MSSALGSAFTITRSTGRCAASGREFATGEQYVATLVERPGQTLLDRLDYSTEAWAGGARPAMPLRVFGVWRATMAPAGAKKQALMSDPELLELFEELPGEGEALDARRLAFRYLLALLLVRRRVLRLVGSEAGKILVRARPAEAGGPEPGVVEVVDPGLDDAAIAQAIEQLGQVVQVANGK